MFSLAEGRTQGGVIDGGKSVRGRTTVASRIDDAAGADAVGPGVLLGVIGRIALTLSLMASSAAAGEMPAGPTNVAPASEDPITLPQSIPDPLEPVNRAIWGLNRGVLTGVVQPSSRLYRTLVPQPFRTSLRNLGRNVLFPGRVFNHLLQANWTGAEVEWERFLANTLVGCGGLFDVATALKIPKADANFGRTFAHWGWEPNLYLMLPLLGPSNDRDGIGVLGDTLADPLTYVNPYPYTSYGFSYNQLSESVETTVRFAQTESDPYYFVRYASTFTSDRRPVDFKVDGAQDPASLQTMGAVFFGVRDADFPFHGFTQSVRIPSTGKRLKYTYWLQEKKAPVVYIVPGLGAHRLDGPVLGLAELLHRNGFGVVCVSSAFHPEFMEHASTAALPAYAPTDAGDLHAALSLIDQRLRRDHGSHIGTRALLGYSMGAFHSLFIAAAADLGDGPTVAFDRVVAINPPVRLMHGLEQLDKCFNAPREWAAEERTAKIRNTLLKVSALAQMGKKPDGVPPFDFVESRFLIGGAFRLVLRDAIYSSQRHTNLHVLKNPLAFWNRQAIYDEILRFSYEDYFTRLAAPYYRTRGVDLSIDETQKRAADLRSYTGAFQANDRIRVISNRNDILLSAEDVQWMEQTFAPRHLTLFDQGGHLGNLSQPVVQKAIIDALDGL